MPQHEIGLAPLEVGCQRGLLVKKEKFLTGRRSQERISL